MKFGKQIQGQALSEWSNHYMNYKALKKVINSIQYSGNPTPSGVTLTASPPTLSLPVSSSATADPLQSLKATFFFKLERELDRVNGFYLTKEADVKLRLRTLLEKKRIVRESTDNPATLKSIQEALWQVQQELTKLQQYVELNATGFRKILKKWDKRSKSSTKELYLARQVEIQPCFNRDTLTELTDIIAHHLAELSQLNIHVASPTSQPSSSLGLGTSTATTNVTGAIHSNSASSSPVSATLRPVPSPLDDLDADLANAAKAGDTHRLTSLIQSVPSASTAQLVVARLIQRIARSAATSAAAAATASASTTSSAAEDQHVALPPSSSSSSSSPNASSVSAAATAKLDTQIAAIQTLLQMHPHAALVTDDINHRSAIHCAAISRLPPLLAIVLSALPLAAPASSSPTQATPLDARDMYGRTPLHYAAMHADMQCASMLVAAGARAGLVDHDGCTSLVYAVVAGDVKLVDLLMGAAKDAQDAHLVALAARYGHLEVGNMLIERGIKVESDDAGLHPLHITAKQGHLAFTQLLCAHVLASASPSLDISDKYYNWTPLFYAAAEGHVACCQVLLDHSARADLVDETGWTAMTHAVYRGHVQVASLLNERVTALAAAAAAGSPATGAGAARDEDVDMEPKEIQPIAPSRLFVAPTPPAPMRDDAGDANRDSMDLDAIPSLALPPPILPFRIYGHMYLESKFQIQVSFPSPSPILLYAQNLASLRIVLAAKPDQGGSIPHTIILPLDTSDSGADHPVDMYALQVPALALSALHIDVFPVYGTRPIARGVVLARQLAAGAEHGEWQVPLFDGMALVGELAVRFAIVRPFAHPRLAVGGAVATYWKTTQVLTGGAGGVAPPAKASSLVGTPNAGLAPMLATTSALMASPVLPSSAAVSATVPGSSASANTSTTTIASLITASSLAHKYVHVPVHMCADGVPVVYPHATIDVPVAAAGTTIPVPVANLTAAQFKHIGHALGHGWAAAQLPLHPSASQLAAAVRRSHFTLRECLETVPRDVGVVVEVMHEDGQGGEEPAAGAGWAVNALVDSVLKDVYDCATTSGATGSRPVIFCSLSRAVCNAINWKQPNYAVFFSTYAGYPTPTRSGRAGSSSLKEAIRFAKANNMLGILVYAQPLVQVPALVPAVKEAGLLCATFGEDVNGDPRWVVEQERAGVDGVFSAGVLRFTSRASEGM